MEVSKRIAVVLLASVVGMLSGGRIQAQNSPQNSRVRRGPAPQGRLCRLPEPSPHAETRRHERCRQKDF